MANAEYKSRLENALEENDKDLSLNTGAVSRVEGEIASKTDELDNLKSKVAEQEEASQKLKEQIEALGA